MGSGRERLVRVPLDSDAERPRAPIRLSAAAEGCHPSPRLHAADEPGVLGLLVLTVVACLALMLVTSLLATEEPRRLPGGAGATHAPRSGSGAGATTLRGGDGVPTGLALS